ncbi:class I SAM-dependent methyltransferase [Parvicella tangerina]|nr:class I SAM-dependent methyltransferase [Parvicella tangerina]
MNFYFLCTYKALSMQRPFNISPRNTLKGRHKEIYEFELPDHNIDDKVVQSFGEEWSKFHQFSQEDIDQLGEMYFDIITDEMVNERTYGFDLGCGTGRWTKVLTSRIGFMEAIDPSDAIYTADELLKNDDNVRLSRASSDRIPFDDETFDFGMSIGVLHHIPDTQKAMRNCVEKVKKGGYFYTYLYYNFEDRGFLFKTLFGIVDGVRQVVSSLSPRLKKFICDIIAIVIYMPLVLLARLFNKVGMDSIAKRIPLYFYHDQSFYIIRNDALDRFGTALEQRFSKQEVITMMKHAGLDDIVVSDGAPYWHAVGKRVR